VSVGSYRFLTSFLLAWDLSSSHKNIPAKKSCLKMDLRTNLRYLIRKYIIKRNYFTLSLKLFLSYLMKSFAILPNESALKEKCFGEEINCTNALAYWDSCILGCLTYHPGSNSVTKDEIYLESILGPNFFRFCKLDIFIKL
jgi:hypothetical protein